MAPKFKFNWRKVLLVVSFLTPFVIFALAVRGISSEHAHVWIQKAGPWGPVVYVLAMLSTFIFAPLSGSPVLFAGFFAFRSMVVWYTLFAAIVASVTNFWIARLWGRNIVVKLAGRENLAKIDKVAQDYGFVMLVLLRFFQGGIHEFVSYAAGLTSVKFSSYFVVSTLSMIPSSIFWYHLSSQVDSVVAFSVLNFTLTVLFAGAFVVAVFIVRWLKRRKV